MNGKKLIRNITKEAKGLRPGNRYLANLFLILHSMGYKGEELKGKVKDTHRMAVDLASFQNPTFSSVLSHFRFALGGW